MSLWYSCADSGLAGLAGLGSVNRDCQRKPHSGREKGVSNRIQLGTCTSFVQSLGNAPKKTQLIVELASVKHLTIIVVYTHSKHRSK
jgi:hypothetical protein